MTQKERQLSAAMDRYANTVYRIALSILGCPDDAEDAVQNTFLRYYRKAPQFSSAEHERNWIIKVAVNCAKSLCTTRNRHIHEALDQLNVAAPSGSLPELLWYLKPKDRILLQLRYAEDYSAEEIAQLLGSNGAAIRKRLERAKKRAEEIYKKEVLHL